MEEWVAAHYYTLLAVEAGYRVVWYTAAAIALPIFAIKVVFELREIRRRMIPAYLQEEMSNSQVRGESVR